MLNTPSRNIYYLLNKLLRNNGYLVDDNGLKLQLYSHPEYPSLKAITDTLDYFEIENLAANISIANLEKLPNSFMAILKDGAAVLVNKGKKIIKLLNEDLENKKISYSEFNAIWSGVIIAIETSSTNQNLLKKSINKYLIIFIIAIMISATSLYTELVPFLMFLFSSMGLLFSYFTIKEELGLYDRFTSKLCDNSDSKFNCSSIINSKSGKLLGEVSLNDLSLVFFLSSTTIIFLLGFNYLFYLVFLSIALPIIFYSIYQQVLVLKKWCKLCLLISLTTVLMSLVLLLNFEKTFFSSIYWYKSLALSIIYLMTWISIKPLIKKHIELNDVEFNYLKFKRNYSLFKIALSNNLKLDTRIENKLSFGSVKPKIIIDAITNPTCGFCKQSFDVYKDLLEQHSKKLDIQVNFIFNISDTTENFSRGISQQLMNIYKNKGSSDCYEAMKYWFDKRNINDWKKKYSDVSKDNVNLQEHGGWCKNNKIVYTPITLINERFYPSNYDIADIKYFIDELILEKRN